MAPAETSRVTGVWVARQVRPDKSYRTSKHQSAIKDCHVSDLREANMTLTFLKESSDIGLYDDSNLDWDTAVMVTVADASFSNEPGLKSQQGFINVLAPADFVNMDKCIVHFAAWSSTLIKRICRATLMAETFSLTKGVENGSRLRAAVVSARGKLDLRNWEISAAKQMSHIWVTDCDSDYEHLVAPKMSNIDNTRLAIDLMALRQDIWERNGEVTEEIDTTCGDYPRWIDTSTMIADPLTKNMKADRLVACMTSGIFDMVPTPASLAIKARNRELRRAKKEAERDPT